AEVPLRILEDDVLEQVGADRERFGTAGGAAPVQLAPRLEPGEDRLASLRVLDARVNPARGLDLWRGQARGRVAGLALRDDRVEAATERLADETVLQPILRVAGVERGAMNDRVLARGNHARRVVERRLRVHQHLHALVDAVVAGRAREDRVEVGGKALHLLERHPSAARAAV